MTDKERLARIYGISETITHSWLCRLGNWMPCTCVRGRLLVATGLTADENGQLRAVGQEGVAEKDGAD